MISSWIPDIESDEVGMKLQMHISGVKFQTNNNEFDGRRYEIITKFYNIFIQALQILIFSR